jgi:hypothetical protein
MAQCPTDAHSLSGEPRKNLNSPAVVLLQSFIFSSSIGTHAVSSSSLLVCAWWWLCLMRHGSNGKMSGMNISVPTMSSTRLFLWNERWPASWPTTNQPVNAVPESAQAKGSRYHGDTWIRKRHAAIEQTLISTALHALAWFSSKTCGGEGVRVGVRRGVR